MYLEVVGLGTLVGLEERLGAGHGVGLEVECVVVSAGRRLHLVLGPGEGEVDEGTQVLAVGH